MSVRDGMAMKRGRRDEPRAPANEKAKQRAAVLQMLRDLHRIGEATEYTEGMVQASSPEALGGWLELLTRRYSVACHRMYSLPDMPTGGPWYASDANAPQALKIPWFAHQEEYEEAQEREELLCAAMDAPGDDYQLLRIALGSTLYFLDTLDAQIPARLRGPGLKSGDELAEAAGEVLRALRVCLLLESEQDNSEDEAGEAGEREDHEHEHEREIRGQLGTEAPSSCSSSAAPTPTERSPSLGGESKQRLKPYPEFLRHERLDRELVKTASRLKSLAGDLRTNFAGCTNEKERAAFAEMLTKVEGAKTAVLDARHLLWEAVC